MMHRNWAILAVLVTLALPLHAATLAAATLSPSEAARTVAIENLETGDGWVSGTVVNKTAATLRGVELLLRQAWFWTDERNPGGDSPGRSVPFTLAGEIAPHGSTPFRFTTPDLARRAGGHFVTTMDVTSFTEVGR